MASPFSLVGRSQQYPGQHQLATREVAAHRHVIPFDAARRVAAALHERHWKAAAHIVADAIPPGDSPVRPGLVHRP
jgi:hypothetical protein